MISCSSPSWIILTILVSCMYLSTLTQGQNDKTGVTKLEDKLYCDGDTIDLNWTCSETGIPVVWWYFDKSKNNIAQYSRTSGNIVKNPDYEDRLVWDRANLCRLQIQNGGVEDSGGYRVEGSSESIYDFAQVSVFNANDLKPTVKLNNEIVTLPGRSHDDDADKTYPIRGQWLSITIVTAENLRADIVVYSNDDEKNVITTCTNDTLCTETIATDKVYEKIGVRIQYEICQELDFQINVHVSVHDGATSDVFLVLFILFLIIALILAVVLILMWFGLRKSKRCGKSGAWKYIDRCLYFETVPSTDEADQPRAQQFPNIESDASESKVCVAICGKVNVGRARIINDLCGVQKRAPEDQTETDLVEEYSHPERKYQFSFFKLEDFKSFSDNSPPQAYAADVCFKRMDLILLVSTDVNLSSDDEVYLNLKKHYQKKLIFVDNSIQTSDKRQSNLEAIFEKRKQKDKDSSPDRICFYGEKENACKELMEAIEEQLEGKKKEVVLEAFKAVRQKNLASIGAHEINIEKYSDFEDVESN